MRALVPLGTRPEIVKLGPVVRALGERGVDVHTVATGQHYDAGLTKVFYDALGFQPDAVWTLEGDEAERVGAMQTLAEREIAAARPDVVLVLGDTHTVPVFSLAARRARVPVVHVEAGLRSFNDTSTEEVNRRVAAATASLHFAPTALAAEFLRREGVAAERIRVVGNPGLDALRAMGVSRRPLEERSGAVVTAHRATNVDDPSRLAELVRLIERLAARIGPVTFPVHPRTRARLEATEELPRLEAAGVRLLEPLPYAEMLDVVASSRVVVTDSGGLQEEAAWLGVPVVVLRRSTPRWEAVLAGAAVLSGLDADAALAAAERFARDGEQARVAALPCPFGDGRAAPRIADELASPAATRLLALDEPDLRTVPPPGVVAAVLVDLDDTLYPQARWLAGAWKAVAAEAAGYGVDAAMFETALTAIAAQGSDRGSIIDRALEAVGASGVPVEPLVEAFRSYEAEQLEPYPGVREALASLRANVPVALVSDGDVAIQRSKLRALDLEDAFDAVVFSDEAGRAFRKPHPLPFLTALGKLGAGPERAVYIGDHPLKDPAGAAAAGLRAVRVATGEYRHRPSDAQPWAEAATFVHAVELLRPLLAPPRDTDAEMRDRVRSSGKEDHADKTSGARALRGGDRVGRGGRERADSAQLRHGDLRRRHVAELRRPHPGDC